MNEVETRIRKARADDAAAAWEIRNAAILSQCKTHYPAPLLAIWTDGAITDGFTQFLVDQFYVATVNDVVVGTGTVDCNTGRLDAVFVRPDMMRQGIGKQMVSFLEGVGRAAGLKTLTLDSTLTLPNSIEVAASSVQPSGYSSPSRHQPGLHSNDQEAPVALVAQGPSPRA